MLQDEQFALTVAERLRAAEASGATSSSKLALRKMRGALMLNLYTEGRTLQEVGDLFGVTRERVRVIIKELVGERDLERLPKRRNHSDSARRLAQERGKHLRATRAREQNPNRNVEIARLVKEGMSYSQVAEKLGVTRNVVCTVMYRENHRTDDVIPRSNAVRASRM